MSDRKQIPRSAFLVFAISLALAACSATVPTSNPGTPPAPSASAAFDQSALMAALSAKGFKVENTGSIEQPFLLAKGISLRVSGGNFKNAIDLQSFSYSNAKSASDDASQIEPSGNPRTARVNWIDSPHFFRKDRVIVIYLGNDASVLALFTDLLGPQFAGK